ncbi:MAG: hypothetical protein ACYDHY_09915 [Acidiferrobacterales bacterium]
MNFRQSEGAPMLCFAAVDKTSRRLPIQVLTVEVDRLVEDRNKRGVCMPQRTTAVNGRFLPLDLDALRRYVQRFPLCWVVL